MKTLIVISLVLALSACGQSQPPAHEATGHPAAAEAEPAKGPHGGRLLTDGDFAIELAIFESGVPPEYRAWPTLKGQPLALKDVALTVELLRLGNQVDRFSFRPEGDYLRGDGVVTEPHSFAVKVMAEHAGKRHAWAYDSFEGRTTIARKLAEQAGIKTERAGPATLTERITLYGQIEANSERVRAVTGRYPGLIRSVRKRLGDTVVAGDVLATIESNESLQTYAVTAPSAGVITQRDANVGEDSSGRVLFTVTDPSAKIAALAVFPRDRGKVKPGAEVRLKLADGEALAYGRIQRIDLLGSTGQSVTARLALDDADAAFIAGSFVTAEVAVASRPVPLAVKASGLQSFRDFSVVYALVDETYEVRMLELGAQHGEWVEVLSGLAAGERYVTENSYLIKAAIEKDGAAHDH